MGPLADGGASEWVKPRAVATFPLSKNFYFRKIAYKYVNPSFICLCVLTICLQINPLLVLNL